MTFTAGTFTNSSLGWTFGNNEKKQRMLNAIEPGAPERIHRHQQTSETVVCLRGHVLEEFL